jgi:hypothetical protein
MEIKEVFVLIGGVHSFGFAVFHLFFWRIFHWKTELAKTSLATRAIIQILNLRLIYLFLLWGFICFFYPKELISSNLGQIFLLGMALFWLGRTIEQFIFLPIKNRMVHILTAFFILGALIFFIPILL